jgi:hypothetical protein
MIHYSFWSYDQLLAKYDRYTRLQAQQWHAAGRKPSYWQLLVRPMWRFFREFVIHRGFLDGKPGLQLAWLAAHYSFMKQARLWELQDALPQEDVDHPVQTAPTVHRAA